MSTKFYANYQINPAPMRPMIPKHNFFNWQVFTYSSKHSAKGKQFQLLKACYGCMESALLRYYTSTLHGLEFKLNPYDKSTTNRDVKRVQQTLRFYSENNNISHKSRKVNEEVIRKIEEHVRKLDTWYFLGMMIRFIGEGKFEIDRILNGVHYGIWRRL